MKKHLTCAIAALFATSAIALADVPSTDEMKAKETAAWQAMKDKNADDFKKLVDRDVVEVHEDGIGDMAKALANMQKLDIKSFTISDFKSHSDEKDVVVTSYKVEVVGTFDGNDMSGTSYAGSVWKLENGAWLGIFHTSVKAEAGAGADAQKKE